MFQAIHIFSVDDTAGSRSLTRRKQILIHSLLQLGTIITVIIAFAAIYLNKEQRNKPHFTSWWVATKVSVSYLFPLFLFKAWFDRTYCFHLVGGTSSGRPFSDYSSTVYTLFGINLCPTSCISCHIWRSSFYNLVSFIHTWPSFELVQI